MKKYELYYYLEAKKDLPNGNRGLAFMKGKQYYIVEKDIITIVLIDEFAMRRAFSLDKVNADYVGKQFEV